MELRSHDATRHHSCLGSAVRDDRRCDDRPVGPREELVSATSLAAPAPAPSPVDPDVVEQVRLAQEGSAHAFALLYDRYVDQIYGYVYHRVGHR